MRHFLFALMFFIIIGVSGQGDQPDEWEFWRKGFSTYESAEQDFLAGNKKEALNRFRTALDYFNEVKKLRPEWNKKAIEYRIELCNKKIEQLSKAEDDSLKSKASALSSDLLKPFKAQDSKKSDSADKAVVADLKREIEKYKAKSFDLTVELENLKKESEKNKRAADEISSILQEKFDLEKKYTELQSKYDGLKKKEPAASPETEDFKKKLIQAKTEEEKLKKEISVLKTENDTLKTQKQELQRNKLQLTQDMKTSSEKQAEMASDIKRFKEKQAEFDKTEGSIKSKLQAAEKQFEESRLRYETKAAETEKYLKELKELRGKTDTGTAAKQIETDNEQLRKNVESLQLRFDKIAEENSKNKQVLTAKNLEFKDLSDTLAALKKERDAVSEEFKMLSAKFDKTEQLTKGQKQYIGELEERNKNLSADIKKFAEGYQGAQDKLKNKEIASKAQQEPAETDTAKSEANQKELQVLNKKITELSGINKNLEKTVSMLTDERISIDRNFALAKTENEKLKKELASLAPAKKPLKEEAPKPETVPPQTPKENETAKAVEPESGVLGNIKKQMEEVNNTLAEYKKQFIMPSSEYTVMSDSTRTHMGQDFRINQPMKNPAQQEPKKEIAETKQADTKQPENKASDSQEKQKAAVHKKLNDDNISLLLKNAAKAESDNDIKSAIWHYNKILQSQADNFEATKKLGLLYAKQDEDDNALEHLGNAYKLRDDDIDVVFALTSIYLKKQKYSQALDILNRAVLIAPKSPVVHRQLAILCHKTGKKEFAEKEFAKSLELDPNSADTMLSKALFLADNKTRLSEARDLYLKAVKMGIKPTMETERIFSISDAGKKDKKNASSFDGISKLNPDANIKPITSKSDTKSEKPSQEIEKTKVDNDTVDFLVREAENAENENDFKTAAWHISKAIMLVPLNAEVQKKAGRIFLKNFNEEKSLAAYEAAYRIKTDDIDIILPLSSLYIKYGKYTQALEMLNMGTVLDPKNAALQRNIAIACKNTGKKDLADKAFRQSFTLDPASSETAMEMALFLAFACYKNDEAGEWYMKAKELGAKPNALLERIIRKQ